MKVAIIENTGHDFYKSRIRLSHFLIKNNIELTVIVPNDGYKEKIESENIKVITVGETIRGSGFVNQLKFAYDFYNVLKKNKFDILHCFRMQPNIIGGFIAGIMGHRNVINHITGLGIVFTNRSFKFYLQKLLVIFLYNFNNYFFKTKFIFQNHDDVKDLKIKSNYSVIHGSSADQNKFFPKKCESVSGLKKEPDKIYFLFASRLLKSKGLKESINAITNISTYKNKTLVLLIAGNVDDENFDSFSAKEIALLAKNKNVIFLGKRNDISELINFSDVCLLPTKYREGTPRFLLESMASAKPIITTINPGCDYLVNEGVNGYICDKNSVDSLESAIKKILDDNLEELGNNSYKLYFEKFSEEIIFNEIIDFYKF